MTLDAAKANALTAAISAAFAAIGTTAATKMPPSKRNTEAVAWEYFVASLLARLAEGRRKRAHAAAVKAGVLFDHEKQPLPVGSNALI
jgi:hypothetical protein